MGRLINLNLRKLLYGHLSIDETCRREVCRLELLKRLLIELGLELLQYIRELCSRNQHRLTH